MENLDPPPPIWKTEKWHVFALRAASSLIWGGAGRGGGGGLGGRWGFAVQFNSVQDCSSLII